MIKSALALIFIVIAIGILVRYIESSSIFYPMPGIVVKPDAVGLLFEDIYFETMDHARLNGWLIKSPNARGTVLFFHGNAGNLSHRLEKIQMFHELGVNIFIIDYRGYGNSSGKPSEQGVYADGLAAYDYAASRKDLSGQSIAAYGDSLGGVVAIEVATKRKLAGLIVDSSFTSAADVSHAIFPFIPTFLLSTKMDSINKVKDLSLPKLFIHSLNDEIIPFALGKKLFEAAAGPKQFLQITGGHNTNHEESRDLLMRELSRFFKSVGLI